MSEETATAMLAGEVGIHIRPFTRLIDITVENRSPKMAQMLANRVAEESISQHFDQNAGNTSDLAESLQKEVTRLQEKVAESDNALAQYRRLTAARRLPIPRISCQAN